MAERGRDFREGQTQLRRERDHAERVAHIMAAGNIQRRFAELFAFSKSAEDAREILQLKIDRAVIRLLRKTERDRARPMRAKPDRVRIIRAVKNGAAGLIEQLGKDSLDRRQVGVKIEMLLLEVENERVLWAEEAQRPVTFIAFRDKIFAARIPMRVRAENRNLRADIMRRMQTAFAQNVRRHRGSRGLAVHPRDHNSALPLHDRGKRFRAARRRPAGLARVG